MTGTHLTQRHALQSFAPFTNIARHFVLQQHALGVTMLRIGNRYGGHQLAGVRMLRVFKYRPTGANFNNLPHVHHRHAMADPLNHRHIVRDKQKRNAQIPL